MSNTDLLTEDEFGSYRPPPIMIQYIEQCRSAFHTTRQNFRIVDWGCGRGKLVLWLREHGYDAVGVDVDPRPFANGAALFRSKGYRLEDCLHALDPNSTAPFADSSFHFVTSWQTLEHVRDLDGVAAEWGRLTMDNGGGFHVYPPHRRPVEGHLLMPLVHWLPKNAARRWLIGAYVLVGIGPNWWPGKQVSWREQVCMYYEYSVSETFYRPPDVVRRCLAAHGFDAEFVDVATGRVREPVQRWLGVGSSSKLVRIWFMNVGPDLGLATSRTSTHPRPTTSTPLRPRAPQE